MFGPVALVCDIHATPCSPINVFGVERLLNVRFFIFMDSSFEFHTDHR